MRRFVSYGPALAVLMTMAAMIFAVPEAVERFNAAQTVYDVQLARLQLDDDDILERISRANRAVAKAVEPSVVHLTASRNRQSASGSGWIYDQEGHVVTNAHVIRNATEFRVQLYDGRIEMADLVGSDGMTDVAVLRLRDRDGLMAARRASDELPEQGDRVFAFGSPFGFKFSMSEGIVSGLGRSPSGVIGPAGFTNLIQTDAAVNPGNSGGPLVDARGRVIGMNVAIATGRDTDGTTEGQSAGISFAIPMATIESVVSQLIKTGAVSRGYIGITYGERARVMELAEGERVAGVEIQRVEEGGPADLAGLRVSDVIISVNNQRTAEPRLLRSVIAPVGPGSTVEIAYVRDNEERTASLTLAEFPQREFLVQQLRLNAFELVNPRGGEGVVLVVRSSRRRDADGLETQQRLVSIDGTAVGSVVEAIDAMLAAGLDQGRRVEMEIETSEGEKKTVRISLTQ